MTKTTATKHGKDPVIEILHRVVDEAAIFVVYSFPFFKTATLEALETIFATKTLGRQLALVSTDKNLREVNDVDPLWSMRSNRRKKNVLLVLRWNHETCKILQKL
jgi:hypothetical protein